MTPETQRVFFRDCVRTRGSLLRAALVTAALGSLGGCELIARFDESRLDAGSEGGVDGALADATVTDATAADAPAGDTTTDTRESGPVDAAAADAPAADAPAADAPAADASISDAATETG